MSLPALSLFSCQQNGGKPNFLIIMTDQQRWDTINAAGNDEIYTPNLDKLISESVYFSEAVCPVPVSGPSRTCMLTGYLLENTHVYTNADSDTLHDCRFLSYDQILADSGYKVEYYGKFHSPEQMAECYSNQPNYGLSGIRLIREWEQIYRHYLLDIANTKSQIQRSGQLFDFSFYGGLLYEPNPMDKRYDALPSGILSENARVTQPDHHGTLLLDDEYTITAFQAKQTIDAIARLKDEKFSITCSFHSPHAPMLATSSYLSYYDIDSLSVPKSVDDCMETNPYLRANGRMYLPEYRDPEKLRYMKADYYALITEIDYWVGKILDKLSELGLDKNTVVIFMSDHGEMLGAHGMREKNNFLEESVRVPLIIRDPRLASDPKIVDTPVSCLNVFQTIMDYAGKNAVSDGYSLRPLMEGNVAEYDFAVSEWNRSKNVPNLMVRTQKWKLIVNTQDLTGRLDALYDLESDPYEMSNLLYGNISQEYRTIAGDLMEGLISYMAERNYPYMQELCEKADAIRE